MARATVEAADEIIDRYFPVLDHGFIALVDYMGSTQAIIDAARTSYGAGTTRVNQDRALIRKLYRPRHTSPFEMVELKFHCKMPIMVARQWIRHRTANVNEYSGRYSLMPMQFYTPKREQMTTQSKDNKQGRTDNMLQVELYDDLVRALTEMRRTGQLFYETALGHDVAREVARLEMPLTLYTEWYWKIDLHNLFHFLGLRCDSHAQWEVRQYADLMAAMTKRLVPEAFEAWLDYHPNMGGVLLSRQELYLLRSVIETVKGDGDKRNIDVKRPPSDLAGRLRESGSSKREVTAFLNLFDPAQIQPLPTFDLDLTTARDASYFEAETQKYVPKVEKSD